jgi:hypothetical protein
MAKAYVRRILVSNKKKMMGLPYDGIRATDQKQDVYQIFCMFPSDSTLYLFLG